MGRTFRKDSNHNKYRKRDEDARNKFSKKFKKKQSDTKPKNLEDITLEEEYGS